MARRLHVPTFANTIQTVGGVILRFDAQGVAVVEPHPRDDECLRAFLRRWRNHGARELPPETVELASFPVPTPKVSDPAASAPVSLGEKRHAVAQLPPEVAHSAFAPVSEDQIVGDEDEDAVAPPPSVPSVPVGADAEQDVAPAPELPPEVVEAPTSPALEALREPEGEASEEPARTPNASASGVKKGWDFNRGKKKNRRL